MLRNAKIYGDFYSPERLLSYGRPWMFSVGSRSIGKTTGWAIYILNHFIKTGHEFIYMRRDKDELMLTCQGYFDNAVAIINQNGGKIAEFKYDSRQYYIRMEGEEDFTLCGYAIDLNREYKRKSANYSKVEFIIYDEFLAPSARGYLGSKENFLYEYDRVYSLFCSVDRGIGQPFRNEAKIIFMGNNSSYFNPLFLGLGIDKYVRADSKVIAPKGELWVLEQTSSVKATEAFKDSNVYKLGSQYQTMYTFENDNGESDNLFIEKTDKPKQILFNMKFDNVEMGVYYVINDNMIYIDKPAVNRCRWNFALTSEDHSINTYLVTKLSDFEAMQQLKEGIRTNRVRFANGKYKHAVMSYFQFIR